MARISRKVRNTESFIEHLENRQLMAADLVAIPGSPDASTPGVTIAAGDLSRFGNVAGQHKDLKALVGGTEVDFHLDGPGAGRLVFNAGKFVLNLTGTTDQTNVHVDAHAKKGDATPIIKGINAPKSLHDLTVNGVELRQAVKVKGSAHHLDLGTVRNGNISIGAGNTDGVDIKMDDVFNTKLASASPIKNLNVKSWSDAGGAADRIDAPWIGQVHSDGAFGASLVIAGGNNKGVALDHLDVKGALTGTVIARGDLNNIDAGSIANTRICINGDLKSLNVKGDVTNSNIAATNIGKVEIKGDVTGSHVDAGCTFGTVTNNALFAGAKALRWMNGAMGDVKIEGDVSASAFTASVRPVDGIFGNGNDKFVAKSTGGIGKVDIKGTLLNSAFEGHTIKHVHTKKNAVANSDFLTTL